MSDKTKRERRVNTFKAKNEDFTILDPDGKTIGHIRVKPNKLLWKNSNDAEWYGLNLNDLAEFAEVYGTKQKQ